MSCANASSSNCSSIGRPAEGPLSTRLGRSRRVSRTAGVGHKGRFRPPGLSASYGFSKETFAVGRGKEEEAPRPAGHVTTLEPRESTRSGLSRALMVAAAHDTSRPTASGGWLPL
jgi:hypothetical protein